MIIDSLTTEIINFIYIQTKKTKNKKKIKYIIDIFTKMIFSDLQIYLYTILGILILIIVMNFIQFYYYIKLFILNGDLKDAMSAFN